jgi:two-component system CheB/CheR fusion protein
VAHGGRVEAHSEGVGRGATFDVWLPQMVPPSKRRRPKSGARRVQFRGWRVLAVDDYVPTR